MFKPGKNNTEPVQEMAVEITVGEQLSETELANVTGGRLTFNDLVISSY